MGRRGSGPRRGHPRKQVGWSRASGTPIDPRGPPVYQDIAQVLDPSNETGLPNVDPNIDPEDDDPTFDLQDATVFCQDGKTMANLLEVALKGPFIVRGKMMVEPDQYNRLKNPRCKSVHVHIPNCSTFSIGYEPLTLWAWSVGGWMEIKPAKAYRETYFNMFEAITLYWEIMTAYQIIEKNTQRRARAFARKALRNAQLDEMFYYYAKNAGDGVLLCEVEKRCDKHALFLLDQFDQQSDFDWTRTSFYHWMHERHPDLVTELEAQKLKSPAALPNTADVEMSGTKAESFKPKHVKSKSKPEPRPVPTRTSAGSPALRGPLHAVHSPALTASTKGNLTSHGLPAENVPTIIALLEEIASESGGPFSPKSTYQRFTSKMFAKCKLPNPNYYIPREILQLYAADLLENLDQAIWKGSKLWVELEDVAKQGRPKLVHLQSIEEISEKLVRRHHRTHIAEASTPPRIPERPYAGKTPSLRLSAVKKRPLDEMELGSDVDDLAAESSAKPSSLVPSVEANAPRRRGRPAKYSKPQLAKTIEPPATNESGDQSDSGIGNTTKVVLRSYPLQTDKPTGPKGTWVCSHGDCGHVVRSAGEVGQRKKVLDHMKLHTNNGMDLADQAREEGQRNGLPVSALLEKIMNDAAKNPERMKRAQLGW